MLWAGGHVREEDKTNGNALTHCVMRELQEELCLSVNPTELQLLGALFVEGGRTGKHVAIVYEWRAKSDDVAIALSKSEFYERRGTSLRGEFVQVGQLVEDVEKKRICEQWSIAIVSSMLGGTPPRGTLQLI